MKYVVDQYGRSFKTLRVSLLSRCNLGCVYCTMGEETVKNTNTEAGNSALPFEAFLEIIGQLHQKLQFETIRLTGGEPLLYPQLAEVIKKVKQLGIPQIKLTTNGFLLARTAEKLKQAGLQSINVSLDAIDEDVFFLMSRRNQVHKVLDGIDAARKAGLEVKLNSVVMKGMNDAQILPLLEYAWERQISVRFLEIMAMGHLYQQQEKYLFREAEILNVIAEKYTFTKLPRNPSATANYWQTEHGFKFGIIANESEPFCHDCNRLRLDSEGNIYGCLSSNQPVSLIGVQQDVLLQQKLQQALAQKQSVRFTGSALSMMKIGG